MLNLTISQIWKEHTWLMVGKGFCVFFYMNGRQEIIGSGLSDKYLWNEAVDACTEDEDWQIASGNRELSKVTICWNDWTGKRRQKTLRPRNIAR